MMRQGKPITNLMADALVNVIRAMGRFSLEIVKLPRGYEGEQHA